MLTLTCPFQPSSKQSSNAELVAGAGNREKGVQALQGVSIPMFTAPGMVIRRESGEVVTPYYFAYEDLKEDWVRIARSATSGTVSKEPKVEALSCLSPLSHSSTPGHREGLHRGHAAGWRHLVAGPFPGERCSIKNSTRLALPLPAFLTLCNTQISTSPSP